MKIPHAFLDMVVDKCQMVETVQKTVESPQLVPPLSVSVDGVSQQRRWFLRCHGLRAILATATLLLRASLCRVSRGVWRKVSSPEVLRLLFCEHRMRYCCVWCSSHSSPWTGWVPGSCFLDKVVDVPVLATSWGSRGSAAAVPRLVFQLIMAMMSSCGLFLGPCTQVHGQG